MHRKNRFITVLSATILLLVTQILYPITSFGEVSITEQNDTIKLYQTIKSTELVEGFTIKEGTYLYGKEQNEGVSIQYAGTYMTVSPDVVKETQVDETTPSFHEPVEQEIKRFSKDASLYSISPDAEQRAIVRKDLEYPVAQNQWGLEVIYIGNVEFYLSKEDRTVALEKQAEEHDTSNQEVQEEDVERPDESLDEEKPEDSADSGETPVEDKDTETTEEGATTSDDERGDLIEESTDPSNEDSTAFEENAGEKEQQPSDVEKSTENNASFSIASIKQADPWEGVSSNYFKVTTDNLVVYDNRGDPLKPMGKLQKGQVYPRVSDYGNWHRIQYGDIYGYVWKEDTLPSANASVKNENRFYENQKLTFAALEDVVVYDNTSGSLVPYGVIDQGQTYPISTDYGNWWRVIFSDRVGYVSKSDVEVDIPFTKNHKYFKADGNLAVYDNRGSGLKKVGELKKGQVYPRVSDYGNWHRIEFGNYYGYVRKSETSVATGSDLTNENKNYKSQSRAFTALKSVTVYDNTSGNLVPYGTIEKGTRFAIATDYGNWWRVIYAGRIGYVQKSDVQTDFLNTDKYFKANGSTPVYDNRGSGLKKVGELEKGQVYPRVSDYGNWHRIQFGNYYGYVRKSETSVASGGAIKNLNKNYTSQSRTFRALEALNVYDNSSGSLKSFGKIVKGTNFAISSDYGNWWRVIYADRVGYVSKDQVQVKSYPTDKYFRAIQNSPVYDNRTGDLIKVGEVKKDQAYPIASDYGNWWRVQFGNIYGYVLKENTGYATKNEINNLNSKYKHSNDKIIAIKNATVYDNSSGKRIPFGELEQGAIYPIATDYGNWWRIVYLDRVGYVSKSDVKVNGLKETEYNISLDEALQAQLKANPQTTNNYKTYISKKYVNSNNEITASVLNVRGGPSTDYWVVGQLSEGNKVTILREVNDWYEIEFTKNRLFVNANASDTLYYLDPLNFINDNKQRFQFLDLSRGSDVSASILDNFLKGKGKLAGQGQAFIDASRKHRVNDIYLVSHAILETGNGGSPLAQGVKYNGTTVYNMFGVGAYDGCAVECGAKKAYEEGWTTPYKAIVGGAHFIGNEYIKGQNREGTVLNTLYKMRWNPEFMAANNRFGKQYATDIGWASKQVNTMYNLYQKLDSYTLYLDVPVYKK